MKEDKIIVLIPAYNPDQKMTGLIEALSKNFKYIVVVNDGCSKEYDEVFAGLSNNKNIEEPIDIVVHEKNKGKGRALKTGYQHILDKYPDASGIITVDADGQHTPEDVLKCCAEYHKDPSKVIFGCRDFSKNSGIPARSMFGNRLTSRLMKFFCDIELSDTQTGLRLVPVNILPDLLSVKGERYEYEMNVIFELKDMDQEWKEVPIEVIYIEDNASSHFNPIKDSLRIYKVFFKFCLSSLGSALVDLVLFSILSFFLASLVGDYKIILATVIARICSGIFNYLVNRWIFSTKRKKAKASTSGPKYLLLWLVQMFISAILVNGLAHLLPMINATLIKVVIDTILFFISYKLQQKLVFTQ